MCYNIIESDKTLTPKQKGMNVMGTIVCQSCLNTIEHYEDEKVSVLFSNCCTCEHDVELDD